MFPKGGRIIDNKAIEAARRTRCEICGDTWILSVHHIKPRGRHGSGDDVPENLVTLCFNCHTKAHNGQLTKEQIRTRRRNRD